MNYSKGVLSLSPKEIKIDDEVILDFSRPIDNKSRIPIISDNDKQLTVYKLLSSVLKRTEEYNKGTEYEKYMGIYIVMSILITDHLMRHADRPGICEIGCNNGVLSMSIAMLLQAFDPDSKYVCVTNCIGNESGTDWLDRISCITPPSGLSLLASDFHDTMLKDEGFDCTLINGTVRFDDPLGVLKEAGRITSKKGKIVCYSREQPLLDDGFKLIFDKVKEWRFDSNNVLYLAEMT